MPRNVTVTFEDGTKRIYQNVPDDITPELVEARALKDFSKRVINLDGGRAAPQGEGSWLGDVGRSFAQGVVGAGKSLVDVFGAETAPSQYLEGVQQQLQQGLTPARQAEIQRRKQLEEEAVKSGNLLNEIGTFLGGVAEAPVQSLAQGLGSVVPFIGTGVVGGIAKLGAPAVRALNTVVGAAMGTGSVKGSLYDNVEAELKKQGVSPDEAKAKAQEAQAYLGDNFLSIVAGGALGAYGARTGVEKLLTKEGKEAAAAGVGRRVGKAILEEAPVEAAQAGQEQLAINLALQKQGIDVDAFRGVAGAAARDAAIGALAAGTVGAVRGPETQRPTPAPTTEAEAEAEAAPETPLTPEEQKKKEADAKLTGIDFDALSKATKTGKATLKEAPAVAPAPATVPTENVDVTADTPAADDITRAAPALESMGFADFSKITTPEQQAELVRLAGRYATATATPEKANIKKKIGRLLQTGNVETKKQKGRKDEEPIVGGEQPAGAKAVERRDVSGAGVGVPVSGAPAVTSAAAGAGRGGLDVAQGPAVTATEGKGEPAGALTGKPVASFKTEKGSSYEVDSEGLTTRTKRSPGRGQGETYAPHTAFYVKPGDHTSILSDMQSGMGNHSVRLGYTANNTFTPVQRASEVPQGAPAVVGVFDKNTNKLVGLYPADTRPAVGLHPVEKRYEADGTASTHVGNRITSVTNPEATATEDLSAEEQAALQAELAAEQGIAVEPAVEAKPRKKRGKKPKAEEPKAESVVAGEALQKQAAFLKAEEEKIEGALERTNASTEEKELIADSLRALDTNIPQDTYERHLDFLYTTKNGVNVLREAGISEKQIAETKNRVEATQRKDEVRANRGTKKSAQIKYFAENDKLEELQSNLDELVKNNSPEEEIKAAQDLVQKQAEVVKNAKARAKKLGVDTTYAKSLTTTYAKSLTGRLRRANRAARGGVGMGKPAVQQIVDRIKAKWKGAPKIEVAASYEALPRPLREFLTSHDAEDARGVFYIPTKTVYIIAANNDTEANVVHTLAHETIGHFGLRKVLGDKYVGMMNLAYMNPSVKALADNYIEENPGTSKAVAVEEALAELVELGQADKPALRRLMDRITSMIRQFLRYISNNKIADQFSDAEVRDLLAASRELVESGEGSSTTISTVAPEALLARSDREGSELKAKAAMAGSPREELKELSKAIGEKYEADLTKASLYKKVRGLFTSAEGRTELVRRFQNDRIVAKRLEDTLNKTGLLKSSGNMLNNIYTQLTLASGRADEEFNKHVYFPLKDLEQSIFDYTKASGLDLNAALQKLHFYMIGMHEQERRQVKYIRTVPLDNTTKITVEELGITDTPAEIRRRIYQTLDRNEDLVKTGEAKYLRNLLNDLVAKYKKEGGFSTNGYKSTDINNSEYNVVAEMSREAVDLIRSDLANDPNKELIDKVMGSLKEVHKGTTDLNKQANYWTQPVSNYVDFYGYKNYVPFKGRPEPRVGANEEYGREAFDDPNSKRFSGDYVDAAQSFEGRTSISANPLLQSMADAARASLRLARKDVTLAVYNLLTDKNNPTGKPLVRGKVIPIKFDQRDLESMQQYKGNNYIHHFNSDGSISVLKLNDPNLVEAIRRSFRKSQPLIQLLNSGTSLMGQLHTRYNPAFAPMNFVRDALTNAAIMGVEGKAGFDYLSAVASKVASGGMFKVGKVAKLYAQRNMAAIREMAKKDDFIKDMLEYIGAGGRVSYVQGITAMGQMDELVKDIGRSRLIRSKEQLDKWVDVWTDTFELASRTAAYSVAKKQALAEGKSEADARTIAAAYAKNLANFEQVGEWGRAAGAMFMFFRPAATGAVRAIDALAPAFQNVDKLIDRLPENIRNNEEAVAKFRAAHLKQQEVARRMMASIAGAGIALYMMAWMMSDDDEMGRNRVAADDMARWTRYLRLPVPGTDIFLQLPWGFGPGAFAAGGAQIAGAVMGKTSIGDALGNIATIGLDSFLPIPVSRINPIENPAAWLVDSALPSLARPLVEYMMNVDSLGREIYNNRKTRYGDAYTGGDNIPELYKDLARAIADGTLAKVDVSPNTLYFFANNYLDAVTRVTHNLYNMGLTMAGKKDFDPKTDTMIFESFIGKKSNFDAREFSSVEKQIEAKIGRMKMFREANPEKYLEYIENHPLDPALEELYNKAVGGMLKPLREAANDIRKMDLTPKERKEILDELNLAQNMVKRNLIDAFEAYNVRP